MKSIGHFCLAGKRTLPMYPSCRSTTRTIPQSELQYQPQPRHQCDHQPITTFQAHLVYYEKNASSLPNEESFLGLTFASDINKLYSSMNVDLILSSQSRNHTQGIVTPPPPEYPEADTSSVISTDMGSNGDNIDAVGVMASRGKLGDTNHVKSVATASSVSRTHRSIFGSYWQHGDRKTQDRVLVRQSDTIQRSKSPRCVLNHPHVQVYACPDQGIVQKHCDNGKIDYEVSGDRHSQKQVSSESTLRPFESRPLSLGSMWSSLPAIFRDERFKVLSPRPVKSEPALGSKKLKSNLRQGRFSAGSVSRDTRNKVTNVSFQPLIKVHPFEPPMDCWAESGWSKQFDS